MDVCTAGSKHPDIKRQAFLLTFVPALVLVLLPPVANHAQQVTTKITSSGLNTRVTHVGHSYNITGGTRPGNGPNLFHSFGNFSIGAGDIGNFLNTPVNGTLPVTSNILGRVTGGNLSNIYGTLQTTDFGAANLFLMNPAGIVLGPSASLNVGGSVSFTSAQYIRLFDGVNSANFYANPANDGLANSILAIDPSAFEFLSASPAAYGFLTAPDPGATIRVLGSAWSVPTGQSISLIGGKVVIQGATLPDGTIQPAQLSASNGTIQLASATSPGEFAAPFGQSLANATTLQAGPNNPADPATAASFSSYGLVSMAPGSSIDVHGASTVFIKGGQLVLSVNEATLNTSASPAPPDPDTISLNPSSSIVTSNSGAGPGADMQITVGNLNMDGAQILTETVGLGHGGNVDIHVGTLRLLNESQMSSVNISGVDLNGDGVIDAAGVGGNITIQGTTPGANSAANSAVLSGGSGITSGADLGGDGGQISISAKSVDLDGASFIRSTTFAAGTDLNGDGAVDVIGHGGDIVLNVQRLNVVDGSLISSSTGFPDPSAATGGAVMVQGLDGPGSKASSVTLSGQGSGLSTDSVFSAPGDITVNAGTLTITNSAVIGAGSTTSTGPGGKVTVNADSVAIPAGGQIFSQSFAQNSGTVTIRANGLSMDNGLINTSTFSETGGRGGDVVVSTGTVSLTNGASINSQIGSADFPFGTGRAGDITMNVGSLTLANHAVITSNSQVTGLGAGDAGNITISAPSPISLSGGSSITSSTAGPGNAGQILLTTPALSLNNASLTTSTSSSGNAGSITIAASTLSLTSGSQISSASTGTFAFTNPDGTTAPPGSAGNITITASGPFTSDASTVRTSAEANHGGDISITAQNVQLSNGTVINASSNAPLEVTRLVLDQSGQLVPEVVGNGNAGNITITSATNFIMQNSSMTTAASQASGGQISISTPNMAQLIDSEITTSVAGSASDTAGGDITIDPTYVILQGSQILAQANAGTGGNITIVSNVFLADPNSVVDASSTLGVSGVVDIRSPVSNISGVIGQLPQSLLASQALLRAACAARLAESQVSSFVERGRDSIPPGPEWLLATPYLPPSSEPSVPLGAGSFDRDREPRNRSLPTSGIQARRLFGPDSIPRVQLLSDEIACGS